MSKGIALILILSFWVLFLLGITTVTYYNHFNTYGAEEAYGYGTYIDAIKIVDDAMSHPEFEWIGDIHGNYKDTYFSRFHIKVSEINMKLSFFDYIKYKKYITSKYKDYIKNKEPMLVSDTPWSKL